MRAGNIIRRNCWFIILFFFTISKGQTIDENFIRGNLRYDMGDYSSAITYYTKVIEINPYYIGAYYNRGVARYNTCDHAGAIEDFTRVIQLNPKDIQAFILRGFSKYYSGDKKGACADWEIAGDTNCYDACELIHDYCK